MINNNLKKIRDNLGLSADDIGRIIGVTQATVSRWENGKRKLPIDAAKKISHSFNIPLVELLDANDSLNQSSIDNINYNITIPYYEQKASAGNGIFGVNDNKYPLILDKKWLKQEFLIRDFKDLFAMVAHGDSMEPDIKSGDTLVCKQCSTFNEGVYIVSYLNDIFVKKVQKINKHELKLISFNKRYEDRRIDLKELEEFDFRIIGKVIANIRKFCY